MGLLITRVRCVYNVVGHVAIQLFLWRVISKELYYHVKAETNVLWCPLQG